jgi:hypothetical protein
MNVHRSIAHGLKGLDTDLRKGMVFLQKIRKIYAFGFSFLYNISQNQTI